MLRIGIPRGFYYYRYFNLWPNFFYELGAEVVISPPTNKLIINDGINLAVDEMCLPFKVYLGHINALKKESDVIFVPRIVSVEKNCYTCPKVLGLPDIAKLVFNKIKLFTPTINQYKGGEPEELLKETAKLLNVSQRKTKKAWCNSMHKYATQEFSTEFLPADYLGHVKVSSPLKPRGKLALLGHGYNIFDSYITMSLIDKLRILGYEVLTSEIIPHNDLEKASGDLPKQMFWTVGKELLGATKWLLEQKDIAGIIYLTCFGCGADAMISDLVNRFVARQGKLPLLNLTVDEHTGEAGLITRIEAFTDMLARRKTESEDNLPAYGEFEYSSQGAL